MCTCNSVCCETATADLPELQECIWEQVMRHVPLPERLTCCTLVSQMFKRAAVAATDSICCVVPAVEKQQGSFLLGNLFCWLSSLHQHVTSLQLNNARHDTLHQLHCQHVQLLTLRNCNLMLSSTAAGHAGIVDGVRSLTRLSLEFCRVLDDDGAETCLMALAKLPDLQHLVLGALTNGQQQRLSLPRDLLPQLTKLTYLEARSNVVLSAEALQHLSCLQLLHTVSLDLGRTSHASTAALSALQDCKQLQDLELKRMGAHLALSTAPVLQHHAGQLTALKLTCCSMDTAILSCMSVLQQLDLVRVQLLPSDTAVLLQVLPTLLRLQQLQLSHLSTTWLPASAAYSALTASPALQELELCSCSIPAAAWQFIFPPQIGPQATRLTKLKKLFLGQQWVSRAAAMREVADHAPGSALCAADVERFVRCCPGLQQLQLWCQLQPGVVLTALQALPALTLLRLSGVSASQALITTLAQLTGLQHLCLLLTTTHCTLPTAPGDSSSSSSSSSSSALALQELAQLTALRGLTHLTVHGVQPAAASSPPDDDGVVVHSKAPQGSPPDVWAQLHRLCVNSMHTTRPEAERAAPHGEGPLAIMART